MKYFIVHNKSGALKKKKHFQAQTSAGVCEERIPLEYNEQYSFDETITHPTPYSKY